MPNNLPSPKAMRLARRIVDEAEIHFLHEQLLHSNKMSIGALQRNAKVVEDIAISIDQEMQPIPHNPE